MFKYSLGTKSFFKNKIHFLVLFFLLISTSIVRADAVKKIFTLDSAIKTAIERSPQDREARLSIQRANLDIKKSRLEKFIPKFKLKFNTGLVPEARGNIMESSDRDDDLDGLGPFYKIDLEMIKPVYTFGRISSAIKASKESLNFEQSKRDIVIQDLSFEVVKAYWAAASASRAETLARDLRKGFNEILTEIQKRLKDENSTIDDSDYLKVKSYAFTIEEKHFESLEFKELSAKMLAILLDLGSDEQFEISHESSPEFELKKDDLNRIVHIAGRSHPVMKGINSAIKGLKAKMDLTKSNRYPVIFLAAGVGYAYAGNRTDQTNPFVVDDFNYKRFGASLGMEWKPNFFHHSVKVQKSRVEYLTAIEKRKLLKAKTDLEVNQAFIKINKNKNLLKAARESLKAAKTWLRTSIDNWETGVGELNRLLEAYKAYYRLLGIEIKRENRYNISLAELAHAAGDINLYLKWVKDGRVSFD